MTAEVTRLVAGSRVRGSVETRRLIVDEGAIFMGSSIMDKAMDFVRAEQPAPDQEAEPKVGAAVPRGGD